MRAIFIIGALILGVAGYISHFAHGHNAAPLNPKGLVSSEQVRLMFLATTIVILVAVPTLLVLYFVAWKYRASNNRVAYKSESHHTKMFVTGIWLFPTLIMLLLAIILVPITQKLDPKSQASNGKTPLTIQVIALRWKWLFLYPDQQIATVNTVNIPNDRPVSFELTADDAPMSSFWIPNLAGQLYAMTGHVNHLNLLATTNGDYPGNSAEINGKGFAGMRFVTHVTSTSDFNNWIKQTRSKSAELDSSTYARLAEPSEDTPATTYSAYADDLYNKVIMKYMGAHSGHNLKNNEMSNMNHQGQY